MLYMISKNTSKPSSSDKGNSYSFLLVLLGMLTAFGPIVTDFYLPSLPTLSEYFGSSPSMAQMSITMSLIGLAVGQIIIGTLSDKFGRKRPLIISLILFVFATLLCIFAPNILTFNAMRLLQGIAGAGGIVISRSVSADLYSGRDLTKFLAMIAAVNGIAPVAAPVAGGLLLEITTWKGIFAVLLGIGIILLAMSAVLKESLPANKRSSELASAFKAYGKVFSNKKTMSFISVFAFSSLLLFGYIASSPFILEKEYMLSSMGFALCFGLNALSIVIGCWVSGRIYGEFKALSYGGTFMLVSALLTGLCLILVLPVWILEISFIALMFSFGLLQPPATSLMLNSRRENAGTASAALGASGFIMGGIASPIVGIGNILTTTAILIIVAALLTCTSIYIACKKYGNEDAA